MLRHALGGHLAVQLVDPPDEILIDWLLTARTGLAREGDNVGGHACALPMMRSASAIALAMIFSLESSSLVRTPSRFAGGRRG
jgi:hypothetical protein